LKRVGEIYITIWQALGGGVRATTAFLVNILLSDDNFATEMLNLLMSCR